MKVLITGATGLIGNELIELLLKNNFEINYLSTSKSKLSKLPGCHGFFWNPKEGVIDVECIINVDVIVHLAGATIAKRWTESYKKEILESRIQTTNLLFNLLKENKNQVKQIVSASGTAIYSNSNNCIYNEENTINDTSFLGNVVLEWENAVQQFKSINVKPCILRTGVVFSNNGGAFLEMKKPIATGFGAVIGTGLQNQSWIHITDLIQIYFFAIQQSLEGVYNAVAPNGASNKSITNSIAKGLNKHIFMPNIPKFVMNLMLGEMHQLLFEDKKISSQKIQNAGYVFKFESVQEAIADLLSH